MRKGIVFVCACFWAGLFAGIISRPAEASGICGVPRVDCDTGHVEPASKIVIPETQVTFTANTTGDVSTSKHGYCPVLPNDAGKYLNGVGSWATPAGGSTPSGTGWRHVTSGVEDAAVSTPTYSQVGADPAGAATTVQNNLDAHTTSTGTSVHGLGTAATHAVGDFDASGAATSAYGSATAFTTGTLTSKMDATVTHLSGDVPTSSMTDYQTTADMTSYILWSETTATSTSTKGNVTTGHHGFAPAAPNDSTKYLNGAGAWSVPAQSNAFVTAYSVDYTGLAGLNLLTGGDGTKTIDGKTWTLVNSANLQTAYINDGTHAGLYLRCNTNNSLNGNTSLTGGQLYTSSYNLNSVLDTAGWSELRIWFLITQPHAPNANYEYAQAAFVGWNSGAWGYANIDRFTNAFGYNGGRFAGSASVTYTAGVTTYRGGTTSNPQNYDVMMFRVSAGVVDAYYGTSSGGSFPGYLTLLPAMHASRLSGSAIQTTLDVPVVWMSVISGNTAGASDMLVKKLLVEYR